MRRLREQWGLAAAAVLVPAAVIARVIGADSATFVLAAASVLPLAAMLGEATEQLALDTGPRIGALLNATFGNAAELILGLFLVARGELEVVRASLTGSIIGNLLLVLGAAFFLGGLKHRELTFSARSASTHVVSMTLAVAGLIMASVFANADPSHTHVETVSVGVAVVLVVLYAASLVYSLVTHKDVAPAGAATSTDERADWSRARALTTLAVAGGLVAVASELLASTLQPAVESFGVSRVWVGLILVPIVGNAAEHSTAVVLARRGKAQMSLDIAVGSSAQIALVVTPLLVFAGLLFGHHLTLAFTSFELAALAISVVVVAMISQDGRADWLEGAQLLAVYVILGISSFYLSRA